MKKRVFLICLLFSFVMIVGLIMAVVIVNTSANETISCPMFTNINELDEISEIDLKSTKENFNEDNLTIVEKRTYDYYNNGKYVKIEAYIFNDVEDSKKKYCQIFETNEIEKDIWATWKTTLKESKYVIYKDNLLLFAETNDGKKVISQLISVFNDRLSYKLER